MSAPHRSGQKSPAKQNAAGLPARQAAFAILERVYGHNRTLDDALEDHARLIEPLEARDRGFALLIARTVLRRQGQLDALIDRYLDRDPGGAKGRALRNLLRVGLAQLVFLGTPPHAAVDGCVRVAVTRKLGAFKGLVNAVLRRAAGEAGLVARDQDAARLNCPAWLWRSWESTHGAPATRAIAEALLVEPPLDLTIKPGEDPKHWAEKLNGQLVGPATVRLTQAGDVRNLAGFEDGAWWVQDLAASAPLRLAGDVAGKRVLDMCAAPGGKTAWLAASGAKVTAIDRSASRLRRLEENLTRLGLAADTIAVDATSWTPPDNTLFDVVLVDAPCSGTGTLRRHPDLGRLKGPDDVARLAALQDRLIDAGVNLLKPGGRLVFATCSLETAEGEDRARAFLARHAETSIVQPGDDLPDVFAEGLLPEGWLRLMPHFLADQGGMDGFFAVALTK